MGKRIEQSLAIRDKAKHALRDLYSSARHFGLSHAEIMTRRNDIYETYKVRVAPHWVSSYLDGVWDSLMDNAYRGDLVFGGMVDGVFYSTHSDRADYYEKNGIGACAYSDNGLVKDRGHYWADSLKPFFVSSACNS